MANLIPNATVLDGTTGYVSSSTVVRDESVLGSPGRVVIATAGTFIMTPSFVVTPGAPLSAFAHHKTGRNMRVRFSDSVGGAQLDLDVPRIRDPGGQARRGIPSTFALSKGTVIVPAGRTLARMYVDGVSAGHFMLKPYASHDGLRCWTPGPHVNPDLNLASWPDTLPDLRELDSPRTPTRKGFETDSAIPSSWRIGTRGRILFEGELRPNLEERDTLDQFFESRLLLQESTPFWFVHPDTRQLCRAWFNPDVEISDSGRGRDRVTRIGLILEIA